MEKDSDHAEMKKRRNMLLFRGVPENESENTTAIVVDLVTEKMEVANFSETLIIKSHRFGRLFKTEPRYLVVKFRNTSIRNTVLNAGPKLQGTGIRVSEFLTKNRRAVLVEATRRYGRKACSTKNGVIQIQLPDGSHYEAVSLVELDEISNNNLSTPSSSQPLIESTAVDTIFNDNVFTDNLENISEMNNVVAVGPKPASVVCPSCHATVVSRVNYDSTTKTHVIALLLCLFLCWPCVCVPYCMESCKNANHYCPNCNSYLGTYMG